MSIVVLPSTGHGQGARRSESCSATRERTMPDTTEWETIRQQRDVQDLTLLLLRMISGDTTSAGSFRVPAQGDRESNEAVAIALGELLQGTARLVNSDVATRAAQLYRDWRLPTTAARVVLRSLNAPPFSRLQAAIALEVAWSEPWFEDDALVVLCDLGGIASGRQAVWSIPPAPPREKVRVLLDDSSYELLVLLTREIVTRRSNLQGRLTSVLGRENPVARFVIDYSGGPHRVQ
jgi:hypothetical protein